MSHAHLIVHRTSTGSSEIMLAQKNIYLPPHGQYEYAAIARHAAQYVIPGGLDAGVEQPVDAAVREFFEDTGVQIPASNVSFLCGLDDRHFFIVRNPRGIELGPINAALADGSARSLKSNNMSWVSLDSAISWMGMKVEYQYLPWVTKQVVRALEAGFAKEHLSQRANESHAAFVAALRRLISLG